MKKAFIFIFLCLFVWTKSVFAQNSTVTLWSEDFTGDMSVPSEGKNASYKWTGSPSVEYASLVGKLSPSLLIGGGTYFEAKIYLYGASGVFTLTFKANNLKNVEVVDVTSGKEKSLAGNSGKYSLEVPAGKESISLRFKAVRNVRIDDLLLSAPSGCRTAKPSPSISFDKDTVSAILGERLVSQKLINPNNLSVSYWSSDKSVATVDADGNVTPHSLGYTTVSALFTGNDEYQYEEVSYVLHVDRRIPDGEVYHESFDKFLSKGGGDGSTYPGVGMVDNPAYDDSRSSGTSLRQAYKCIYLDEGSTFDIQPIEALAGNDGYISFLVKGRSASEGRVSVSGGGTLQKDTFIAQYDKWSLVKVPFTGGTSETGFTITGSNIYIDSVSVCIEPKTVSLNVGSAGYSTMYYGTYALKVPANVKAFTMKIDGESLVESRRFIEGDVIPKATGVMVKAPAGTYEFDVTDEEGVADTMNMLRGTDYDMETTGGGVYYMLSVSGGEIGFYWGEDGGAAFLNGAHKAYLALSKEMLANVKSGFSLPFDDSATGIVNIQPGAHVNQQSYNILGQRVRKDFYKGIVIKDGKKFFRK